MFTCLGEEITIIGQITTMLRARGRVTKQTRMIVEEARTPILELEAGIALGLFNIDIDHVWLVHSIFEDLIQGHPSRLPFRLYDQVR